LILRQFKDAVTKHKGLFIETDDKSRFNAGKGVFFFLDKGHAHKPKVAKWPIERTRVMGTPS